MTSSLHRYIGAMSKCLRVICLILLTAQLTYESCCFCLCFHSPGSGAATIVQQPGNGPGSLPNAHCHNKVYLSLDKRYDLRPILFTPAAVFRVAALFPVNHAPAYFFTSRLVAGAVRPACLRGPPSL